MCDQVVVPVYRRILGYWKPLIGILTPIVLLPIPLIYQSKTGSCAYCVLIMAIYWMTEAIPIPVTALLPVVLYPLFGISDTDDISREYLKDSIMVFVGGLLVALAFEYCQLHKRIALRVMLFTGASLRMLMLGTMVTTAFLSMWMFNTATTAMMVPIILSINDELQKSLEEVHTAPSIDSEEPSTIGCETATPLPSTPNLTNRVVEKRNNSIGDTKLISDQRCATPNQQPTSTIADDKKNEVEKCIRSMRTMFLLSTCYSSNLGGTGVVTGSGTNLVALEFLGDLDPKHHGDYASLTFATWAAFNFLPMVLNIVVAWVYLQFVYLGFPTHLKFWWSQEERDSAAAGRIFNPQLESKIKLMLAKKYADLGSVTLHEVAVAICFIVAITSWVR
ncbi:Protein I'm not dead yet [Folsomia candida]|uniref:Protein I'm not dead yet n=1 Tax=Folsomia candida TaxID=158441 RepID=A0A226E6G0_FOLCA|nr:Protein I'm not dead yet [Folsomia candida]